MRDPIESWKTSSDILIHLICMQSCPHPLNNPDAADIPPLAPPSSLSMPLPLTFASYDSTLVPPSPGWHTYADYVEPPASSTLNPTNQKLCSRIMESIINWVNNLTRAITQLANSIMQINNMISVIGNNTSQPADRFSVLHLQPSSFAPLLACLLSPYPQLLHPCPTFHTFVNCAAFYGSAPQVFASTPNNSPIITTSRETHPLHKCTINCYTPILRTIFS